MAEVAKPAPHPLRKPRRPILTGGCRDRCRSPEDAARSFVESLRAGSVDALVPLLEASLLVVEGQAHGPRWVRLWRGRELDTRREEIAAVARTLAERWKEQPFGAPALTGNEKRRQVVVPLPDGRTFRFELSLRGLEWLVSRVEAVE